MTKKLQLSKDVKSGPVICSAAFSTLEENRIRMVGSTTGQPLRDGTVFAPGAFKNAAKAFVESGVMLVGHDWDDMSVGMIVSAAEKGNEFVIEGQFYDTPTAQEARSVVMQRLDNNKRVNVSIGFLPDWDGSAYFENGAAMLKFLDDNGGADGYDAKAIKKLGWCRLINSVTEIFEVSLVTVGMNPNARGTEANGLTFDDDFDGVLEHLDQFVGRWEGIAEKRDSLGESHRQKLGEIVNRLETIAAKADPAPDAEGHASDDDPARAERIKQLMDRASAIKANTND